MKLEILKPGEYSLAAILVNNEYIVELNYTVMGSVRVTCRETGSSNMMANWCGGKEGLLILVLLNAMLRYLDLDPPEKLPFASRIKPYWNDPDFVDEISPWMGHNYYLDLREILPTETTIKSIVDYEKF